MRVGTLNLKLGAVRKSIAIANAVKFRQETMAASAEAAEASRLPVAILLSPPSDGGEVATKLNGSGKVSCSRPGSTTAAKVFGPFGSVKPPSSTFFDELVLPRLTRCLTAGESMGVWSFGPMGKGKTTAMWGSPDNGEAVIPQALM